MAGETVRTEGIVLSIRPWSRTSHVVTWLTPETGAVATLVKGAVRPKSAFLGQYDLFYTCEIVYYARAHGDLHALREASPLEMRERLRDSWRAVALAGYAAGLVRDLAPSGGDSREWFAFLSRFLDALADGSASGRPALVRLETEALRLAGLAPDFSGMDAAAEWFPFAIDRGRCGEGTRTVRLSPRAVAVMRRPDAAHAPDAVADAVRFLGVFSAFHLETPPDARRSLVKMLA